MRVSQKLWVGVGVLATAAANAQTAPATTSEKAAPRIRHFGITHQQDYDFSTALQKHLGGEGGEGGIGFSASGPEFKVPALTNEQLKLALPGNTIRKDQAVAFYFDPSGTVEGWKWDWDKTDMSKCPTPIGEFHEIERGDCYTATVHKISGRYTIKDNQVCMPAYSGKPADGNGCYYIAFVTKYVMIGDGKRTYGSGKDIVKGRSLESIRKIAPKAG
jgi:hypothetical protein